MIYWITRDKSGLLFLYEHKPRKSIASWQLISGECYELDKNLFPEITWNDENPIKIEINKI